MSINISNNELPADNLPHGNMEKQCHEDRMFYERVHSDVSNIKTYAGMWGEASTKNMEKLKVRYESLTTSLEHRLEYWKAVEVLLDKTGAIELAYDDLAKELETTLVDEEFLHEKLLKHVELNRDRIEVQKRILSKLNANK